MQLRLLRTTESLSVVSALFAERRAATFAERKATIFSAAVLTVCVVTLVGATWCRTALSAEPPARPYLAATDDVREPQSDDPDLLLWLDATEQSTLVRDEQGFVAEWRSKGTHQNAVLTAVDSHRPQWVADGGNGHPAVRFDGQDDVLRQLDFGQVARQWTLFLVARPRSNQGSGVPAGFHGFFSATRRDEPDFVAGINVDMGGQQTDRFICLNVESAQGGGACNLLYTGSDFGQSRVLAVRTADLSTVLFAESVPQATRSVSDNGVSLHEVRVGARSYVQGNESGFLDGDIAELIFYRRGVSDDEVHGISQYLMKKHGVVAPAEVIHAYTLEQACEALASYDWEASRASLVAIDEAIRQADVACRQQIEVALIDLLQRSISPAAAAGISERLVLVGSPQCVPVLQKCAAEPQRYRSAIDALERLGLPESDQAFVDLVAESSPPASIALLQSLTRRRVVNAYEALLQKLESSDADEAAAAADALAELGDPRAQETLASKNLLTPDRLVRYAFNLARTQHTSEALTLCERLWANDDPHLRAAGLRGMVLCDRTRAAAHMMAALQGTEPVVCGAAGRLLLDFGDEMMIQDVFQRLPGFPVTTQAMLLGLRWAQRPDAGRALARQSLHCPTPAVQLAGLRLLAEVGVANDVEQLVRLSASDVSESMRQAVEDTLCHLAAEGVDAELIALLNQESGESRATLFRVLRDRRSRAAAEVLAKWTADEDVSTRLQALDALEQLGNADLLPRLLPGLLQANSDEEQAAWERTIWRCALRGALEADPAAPVLAAYERANIVERTRLLPLLGRLGGAHALEILQVARHDSQSAVQAAAVRGLANWPDASVAADLWQLAGEAAAPEQRIWALRGYIRVVTLPGARPPDETARMLEEAWKRTTRDAERRLILQRLPAAACPRALHLALAQLEVDSLRSDAVMAAAQLAESLLASDREAALAAINALLERELDPDLRTRLSHLAGKDRRGN